MKGIDKIILVVGILALGGATAWYFLAGNKTPTKAQDLAMDTIAYTSIEPAKNPAVLRDWPEPKPLAQHNDPKAIFNVFTPPSIYYKDGKFTFKTPTPPVIYPPFGVELLAIQRVPHRIQYNGHVKMGEDSYLIMLNNITAGTTLRGRVGKTFTDEQDQITITSYDVKREMVGGLFEETITLEYRDERDGQMYSSNGKDTVYTTDYTIMMQTSVAPEERFDWKQPGETFSFTPRNPEDGDGKATYTLLDFSLDNNAVKVEKQAPYLEGEDVPEKEKIRGLVAQGLPTAKAEPEKTPTDKKSSNNPAEQFDTLFQ